MISNKTMNKTHNWSKTLIIDAKVSMNNTIAGPKNVKSIKSKTPKKPSIGSKFNKNIDTNIETSPQTFSRAKTPTAV